MAGEKLSKRVVDRLEVRAKDYIAFDGELPGFGVRVMPNGKRFYLIQYRRHGRTRRMALGQHGVVTAEIARREANRMLGAVRGGGDDPATLRDMERQAATVRHTGGRVFGYSRDRRLDDRGELIRGLLVINPTEASLICRILKGYAAGQSPREIASELNAESIPAPRGGQWNASTINGDARWGNGIIHNELYRGMLVFGRQTWLKDRRTGSRHARAGDPSEVIRTPVPHLRIVSERLWRSVRKAHSVLANQAKEGAHRTVRAKHLLSGLMRCGECGGPLTRSGSGVRFMCSWHRERGACANGRSVPGRLVETAYAEDLARLPTSKGGETLKAHLATLIASHDDVRPPYEAFRLARDLTAAIVVTPLEGRGRFAVDVKWKDEAALPAL